MSSIRVFAPATVANLACGFDILGLAINKPGDELIMELNNSRKIVISEITGDGGRLPKNPMENTAGVAAAVLLKKIKSKQGISIRLHKRMPLGSGLGSSAASAVAAAFALNELLGRPFGRQELIPFAMAGEKAACGAAHADNAAPSMLGGITLIRSLNPLEIIPLPVPASLYVAVVHPHVEVMTRASRKAVRKSVPLETVVAQTGHTAAFIAALFRKDLPLLGRSSVDFLAEPYRAGLIPGFKQVKEKALELGAIACSISGSGPSVFALCASRSDAQSTGKAMKKIYEKRRTGCDLFVSRINSQGVKITG
jgi:homoserine kinase